MRGAFAGVVAAVLGLGLLALLGLNTLLGQNAFVIQDLRQQAAQLSDREEALRQEVAELEAPARLADQARALGMVPAPQPAFVDPATGAVLGIPAPGVAPPKPAPVPAPAPAAAAPADPAAAPAPARRRGAHPMTPPPPTATRERPRTAHPKGPATRTRRGPGPHHVRARRPARLPAARRLPGRPACSPWVTRPAGCAARAWRSRSC